MNSRITITLVPAELAMAFMPLVQAGVLGGPNITPCSGWMLIEPDPLTTAGVVGADGFCGVTQSVIVEEGLNT